MGNVNGREEGCANGGGDKASGSPVHAPNERMDSFDLMLSFPTHDQRQARSPLLFSSQAPVDPLPRDNGPSFNPSRQNGYQRAVFHPFEQGMPVVISWSFGGSNVSVEGSWDNWRSRKILQRSGKDHSILVVLPPGRYCYRFIVDGEVKYAPDFPCDADEMGHRCNLLDVNNYVPENLDSVAEFEAPPSPDSSYSQAFPGDEDFAKDPMLVPPQLQSTVFDSENCKEITSSLKPRHVELNHLFVEKGCLSQSVVALGLTHRFQSKYVTVVLYKPLKR